MPDSDAQATAGAYPVNLEVKPAERYMRVQVVVRLVALATLGAFGVSLGTLFCSAYFALPVYAAIRIASLGTAAAYLREDSPKLQTALRWFLAISGWIGMVSDRVPAHAPEELITVTVESPRSEATAGTALLRIITGVPSAMWLMVVGFFGTFVWILAALSVLLNECIGPATFRYLVGLQRYTARLLAYQACLTDKYPPFSFDDTALRVPKSSDYCTSTVDEAARPEM